MAHAAAVGLSGCRESTSEREMEQHLGWGVGHSRHSEQPAGFAPLPGRRAVSIAHASSAAESLVGRGSAHGGRSMLRRVLRRCCGCSASGECGGRSGWRSTVEEHHRMSDFARGKDDLGP